MEMIEYKRKQALRAGILVQLDKLAFTIRDMDGKQVSWTNVEVLENIEQQLCDVIKEADQIVD